MFQTGNLSTAFTWEAVPNVKVTRDRELVGIAELSPDYGIMNAKPLIPMSPAEWAVVKEWALAWMKENPKPPPAA